MKCTRSRHVFIGDDLIPDDDLPPETICECGRYQWGQIQISRGIWTKDVDLMERPV